MFSFLLFFFLKTSTMWPLLFIFKTFNNHFDLKYVSFSKVTELEEELKVVGNNMKSLEVSEQEVEK